MSILSTGNGDLDIASGDALDRDRVVAKWLGVDKQTLARWDQSEKMLALGWPRPIKLNGYKHRDRGAIRRFILAAAAASIKTA